MQNINYILWSSSPDTSKAGIDQFCQRCAGQYGQTVDAMRAMPLSQLIPLMWNELQYWRITAYQALKVPADNPILVIADQIDNTPFAKPERSCFVLPGDHLNEIFSVRQGLSTTFFSDGDNIRCTDISEHGADHYLFREITSTNGLQSFVAQYREGLAFTESDLEQFSCSLAPRIHQIYGWPAPEKRSLEIKLSEASLRADHSSAVTSQKAKRSLEK